MDLEFRKLRVRQLDRALKPFLAARDSPRPQKGWIRAIREATGITLREMAPGLDSDPLPDATIVAMICCRIASSLGDKLGAVFSTGSDVRGVSTFGSGKSRMGIRQASIRDSAFPESL